MGKPIFVQVKIPQEVLEKLKEKSGESTTKEALYQAVDHFINCFMAEKEKKNDKENKKRTGRDPIYLEHLLKHRKE